MFSQRTNFEFHDYWSKISQTSWKSKIIIATRGFKGLKGFGYAVVFKQGSSEPWCYKRCLRVGRYDRRQVGGSILLLVSPPFQQSHSALCSHVGQLKQTYILFMALWCRLINLFKIRLLAAIYMTGISLSSRTGISSWLVKAGLAWWRCPLRKRWTWYREGGRGILSQLQKMSQVSRV